MIKILVTRRNLFQRINRALKAKGRRLRTHLGKSGFYVVDLKRDRILSVNHDLEKLGKELGVLNPWERVEK
jgi:CRISPR/Cas system-associated protein Csx1